MATRKLEVQIIGDSRSLERAFARSQRSAQEFQTGVTGAVGKVDSKFKSIQGLTAGAFVGGAVATAVATELKAATTAASDLNEQISKNKQVFGDSAEAVLQWSQTTSKAIGISQNEALTASGTFGNLFKAIGISGPAAANFSTRLVQLAADLASFNNASPTDTLDAIRSGLVGEAEPLRRYGVLLSETRVQQVAMAQTGKQTVASLTDQEKAAARIAIIFRDTTAAQGDFARTSGGLANQQRILKAEVADLQANLGRLLLPTIAALTKELVDATAGATTLAHGLQGLANTKIPAIHIPFVLDFGGGRGGGAIGNFLKRAGEGAFGATNPGLVLLKVIGDVFKESTAGATPQLANSFAESINTLTQNALDTAAPKLKPPTVKDGVKGFGTGLTPQDLYGPLIKGITGAQTEALLNAQLSGSRNAVLQVLRGIQSSLQAALKDPRLKQAGRIQLKNALKGVNDQIQGILDQVQAETDAANSARQDKRDAKRQREQDRREKERQRRERQHAAQLALAQQRQFRAIGLAPTGQELVPTVANLQKQFESLSKRVVGENVSSKLLARLRLVGKALHGGITDMKEPTRQAIKELFDTIRGTFDQESKKSQGPLTKTTSLNVQAALAGVTGLDREQIKRIRANLSGFNSAGVALAGGSVGGAVNVSTETTIKLDGDVVGRAVTRHQQKTKRRNPPQKRGPNRGGG